ncbi:putative PDZ domain containing protein [Methylacidimicrobium sp. AP8]|uniref:PDZ domain-containing protein n=1 Tax=Methylacidimicrobium sp. AP8 TaxID=2730359 RepID=UPI0018BFF5F0|nr:PDZ domain-containing protein [Methylacidimicrobium sp. AP8]CAB4244172.1 putative PDZ domain containing protein [Methylacidimicrobium sp. AP8]
MSARDRQSRWSMLLPRLLLCWSSITIASFGQEAEGPLLTNPPIIAVFPVEDGPDGVHFRYPVAINDLTVVHPQEKLRTLYVKPELEEKVEEAQHNQEHKEAAYSRKPMPDPLSLTPAERALEKFTRTVWPSKTTFLQALEVLNGSDIRLIYERGERKEVRDEPVSLPAGLLLASIDGRITVLAVQPGQKGERGGFQPGDRIITVQGEPFTGSLEEFLEIYRRANLGRRTGEIPSLRFTVFREGHAEPVAVSLPLPPSLQESLLDFPPAMGHGRSE